MMDEIISQLEKWYSSNCNGEWEHQFGVKIETLDNPGWSVEIDLPPNDPLIYSSKEVDLNRSDSDWIKCRVRGNKFEGFGGTGNLMEILQVFINRKLEQ